MATTLTSEERLARKRHVCDWCGMAILEAHKYRYTTVADEGSAYSLKYHPECWEQMGHDEVDEFLPRSNERPQPWRD